MYRKIIVTLSLEHGIAEQALALARRLRAENGEILALHVHEPPSGSVASYLDEELVRRAYEASRSRLAERVKHHPDVQPVLIKGHASRSIVDFATREGADCIVMASHRPGLRDYLIGSTAARVVRHAPCSVHVLREIDPPS